MVLPTSNNDCCAESRSGGTQTHNSGLPYGISSSTVFLGPRPRLWISSCPLTLAFLSSSVSDEAALCLRKNSRPATFGTAQPTIDDNGFLTSCKPGSAPFSPSLGPLDRRRRFSSLISEHRYRTALLLLSIAGHSPHLRAHLLQMRLYLCSTSTVVPQTHRRCSTQIPVSIGGTPLHLVTSPRRNLGRSKAGSQTRFQSTRQK